MPFATMKRYAVLAYLWIEWIWLRALRLGHRVAWRLGFKTVWPLVWVVAAGLVAVATVLLWMI